MDTMYVMCGSSTHTSITDICCMGFHYYMSECLWNLVDSKAKENHWLMISIFPEVQISMVGPQYSLREIPGLITSYASMDIDLVGISKKNKGTVLFS